MVRVVLLPKDISNRLYNLTQLNEEIDGILFYRQQGDYCPIEASFITGVGTEGNVTQLPGRLEVVNEFLDKNPDYKYVQFHTHSKGTIRKYGQYYARNFSEQDYENIHHNLKDDENYMAMLVTSETKILEGIDNPRLNIVDTFNGYSQRKAAIYKALDTIAQNLGYEIDGLDAKII